MNTQDVDNYFMPEKTPEPPPEPAPAPPPPPPAEPKRNGTKKEAAPDLRLDVGLPCNIDAEKTILGAVLLDNAALKEISISLEADDFFLDSHRRIWKRMADLYTSGRPIDIVTLSAELSKNKEIEAVGGIAYLCSLTEGLPRRPVIDEYIRIVADKSIARRIMAIGSTRLLHAQRTNPSQPLKHLLFLKRS